MDARAVKEAVLALAVLDSMVASIGCGGVGG